MACAVIDVAARAGGGSGGAACCSPEIQPDRGHAAWWAGVVWSGPRSRPCAGGKKGGPATRAGPASGKRGLLDLAGERADASDETSFEIRRILRQLRTPVSLSLYARKLEHAVRGPPVRAWKTTVVAVHPGGALH